MYVYIYIYIFAYMISSIKLAGSFSSFSFIVPATMWQSFSESQNAQTQEGSKRQPSQHDWLNRSRYSIYSIYSCFV